MLIIADHGNADKALNDDGTPNALPQSCSRILVSMTINQVREYC